MRRTYVLPIAALLLTAFPLLAWSAAAQAAYYRVGWMDTAYERISGADTIAALIAGPANQWDRGYENWEKLKQRYGIPIRIGADNWVHLNRDGPNATDYGVPALPGTYYYYVDFDPQFSLNDQAANNGGFFREIGAHAQLRLRDSPIKFRSFYQNKYWWFYEAYGYVDTPIGRIKAGQIWKRFGLDWDDTWWGDVQYFDGFKLDTDYGLSWENTWSISDALSADSFVQYFIAKSNVNGSEPGGDPNSIKNGGEYNIGVLRLVPTWRFAAESSLAVGLSGLIGQIRYPRSVGRNQTDSEWALDLTYRRARLKLFSEVAQAYGRRAPRNYVSGGSSNQTTDVEAGASYKLGPALLYFAWSAGFVADPSGKQFLWVPGTAIALARNVDLIFEYVRWDVYPYKAASSTSFEDGFQLVISWRL